jgi:hypothetical protein
MTMVNSEIAKALGIDLSRIPEKDVRGIKETSKGKIIDKVHLCVRYLPKELTIPIMFIDGLQVDVLLGQVGFFDSYRITFQKDSGFFQIMKSPSVKYDKK